MVAAFRNGAFGLVLVALLAGCGREKRAAELFNSSIHYFDRSKTQQEDLPNELTSGVCRNRVESGSVSAPAYQVIGNTARLVLTVSLKFEEQDTLECTIDVAYDLSEDGRHFVGPGHVYSCEHFSCALDGHALGCAEMKLALRRYTCSSTTEF